MTELEVVKKYSKICYDYNSAIWFDDTLEDDSCFAGSSTISWLKSIKERIKEK